MPIGTGMYGVHLKKRYKLVEEEIWLKGHDKVLEEDLSRSFMPKVSSPFSYDVHA